MIFYLIFVFFILALQRIKPFLVISMNIKNVDDCLMKVELDDGTILYKNTESECYYNETRVYEIPMFIYELGQKIIIIIC